MNKKKTTEFWIDDEWIKCVELPDGYFYKNKFYTENGCFKALLKDDEVRVSRFTNGTWRINDILFASLVELHEYMEDEANLPSYNELLSCYEDYGIERNNISRTLYSFWRDDYNQLYDTKGEVVLELRNETGLVETTEDREERYLEDLSKKACIAYLKKPVKERIKILEEMKN